ncbi:MAG TPA: hypothetical protein VK971_04165 [Thiohalobacter sp.]|nr:hypothetical protein [Thiohalobacter sp.]
MIQNAAKHGGGNKVQVQLQRREEAGALISVSTPGRLPEGFDFDRGVGLGTGLELVRALLPQQGAQLGCEQSRERVHARLELKPPLIHF